MDRRRTHRAALLAVTALLGLAGLLAGCGDEAGEGGEPVREGLAVEVEGLEYNVFITRQLNLSLPEDKAYYGGPPAPAGSALYGVFIEVCNRDDGEPVQAAEEFKIKDTQGAEFEPVELDEDNAFAYHPQVVEPGACIPARGSVAQLGPTSGAMLLFELPQAATENRPLELEISSPSGAETLAVELDV